MNWSSTQCTQLKTYPAGLGRGSPSSPRQIKQCPNADQHLGSDASKSPPTPGLASGPALGSAGGNHTTLHGTGVGLGEALYRSPEALADALESLEALRRSETIPSEAVVRQRAILVLTAARMACGTTILGATHVRPRSHDRADLFVHRKEDLVASVRQQHRA